VCETRNNRRQIKFASQQKCIFPSNYFQLNQIVALFFSRICLEVVREVFIGRENGSITKQKTERRKAINQILIIQHSDKQIRQFLTTRREEQFSIEFIRFNCVSLFSFAFAKESRDSSNASIYSGRCTLDDLSINKRRKQQKVNFINQSLLDEGVAMKRNRDQQRERRRVFFIHNCL
jgi:hypothetical protein